MTGRITPELVQYSLVLLERTKAIARARAAAYVYVIGREQGPIKVGVSSSPSGRLAQLQTGCPFKLEVLHTEPMLDRNHALKHEADFHAVYADKRLHGEWFDLEPEYAIELIETGLQHEAWFQARDGA